MLRAACATRPAHDHGNSWRIFDERAAILARDHHRRRASSLGINERHTCAEISLTIA
jgi:hypothetical protein